MAFTPKFVDLVRNVATVTGTGPVTLGAAVNGYSSLAGAVAAGEQFYYCIQGIDKPTEREIGRGTMQADGRVARQAIAGALTSFTGGTKTIALVAAAEWFATLDQMAGAAAARVASRSELAARPSGTPGAAVLGEAGREGLFQFDPSDLSAEAAADTAQGIYIAPAGASTGASGAWVRKFDGPVNPLWFGLSTANTGAQNDAAMLAMFATLRARSAMVGSSAQAVERILFPAGLFNFDSTIDLTDGTWLIEGVAPGDSVGTVLKFPAGVTGIRVQRSNTSGTGGPAGTAHKGSDRSIIRNLQLDGAYSGADAETHGIHLRARAYIERVIITDFQGDGIHIRAVAGGDPEGNANCFRIDSVRSIRNRNGFYCDGPDVNAGVFINCDGSSNRRWGFFDSSFLGNTYVACHTSDNGRNSSGPTSACSFGGNRYYVKVEQAAGASTNAPTGTTADNTWWGYLEAGGPTSTIPAWVSGMSWTEGGAYGDDTDANSRNVFLGCYSEGNQNPSQLSRPTQVLGGLHGGGVKGTAAYMRMGATGGAFESDGWRFGKGTFAAQLGEVNASTALFIQDDVVAPSVWRLRLNGNDLQFDYANSNGNRAFAITGPNTTQQFGTGAAQPHALWVPHLTVGDETENISNSRRVMIGTAAPASGNHAAGEIMFNRIPASGQPMGWVCSAAGSPGTWLPLANVP